MAGIKTVQHRTITLVAGVQSTFASITPVNFSKSVVIPLGVDIEVGAGFQSSYARVFLNVDGTTVHAIRSDIGVQIIVNLVVREYN